MSRCGRKIVFLGIRSSLVLPTTYVYVDEAGRSRVKGGKNVRQPYFIVGVLLANDPDALLSAVREARTALHFDNELHWTKQSDLRARVYREVARRIGLVQDWEFKATRFQASAVDLIRQNPDSWPFGNHNRRQTASS